MTKEEMIYYIMEINKAATREFLEKFSVEDLEMYIDHLIETAPPDNAA